jgi:hypothetical protein
MVRKALVFFSAVLALAACQPSPLRPTVSPTSGPSTSVSKLQPPSTEPPRCGVISLTSKRYGMHIEPTQGRPGNRVAVFGPTFRGEDGRFLPSDRLEVWWNTKVPTSEAPDVQRIKPGPVVLLTIVSDMSRCRFRAAFKVPDVRPGSYRVVAFVFHEGGYGWFGSDVFRVIADS